MPRCFLSLLLQTIEEIESEVRERTSSDCCAYRYVILTVKVKLRHNWELEYAMTDELYYDFYRRTPVFEDRI